MSEGSRRKRREQERHQLSNVGPDRRKKTRYQEKSLCYLKSKKKRKEKKEDVLPPVKLDGKKSPEAREVRVRKMEGTEVTKGGTRRKEGGGGRKGEKRTPTSFNR